MRYLVPLMLMVSFVAMAQPPVIAPGQTRQALSSTLPGTNVGDPLFATGAPTAWTIITEDGSATNFHFSVSNAGQVSVFRDLTDLTFVGGVATVVLEVQAFNNDGFSANETIDVVVFEDTGANNGAPEIPTGLSRTVVTTAEIGEAVGSPIFASNDPEAWFITAQDNPAPFDDEITFEIDNSGQITVLSSLVDFHPAINRSTVSITLTIVAVNAQGEGTGTVTINVLEGPYPIVRLGQSRSVATTDAPGTQMGDPIAAFNDPTYWYISGGSGAPYFNIANDGQISNAVYLDPESVPGIPGVLTLQVVAGNADGESTPVTVNVTVNSGLCGYIPATQTRFVSSIALPDTAIGFPIDIHVLDSVWIERLWINGNLVPPDDFGTYFSVDASGSTIGQIRVLRPLSQLFDTEAVTEVQVNIRGHDPTLGCPDFYDELVSIYVVPDDAGSGTGDDGGGGGDGGTDPTNTDFSPFITDVNLRACIRQSLGLADSEALTIDLVVGLTQLDCLCRSDNAITNLDGIHLFVNLTFLQLANNLITDIENLSGLRNLVDLRLANNMITDIQAGNPLASMDMLARLDLSNNQIENVDALAGLSNIQFLSLANNNVCDIAALASLANPNVGGITAGDTIYLDNNNLTSAQALNDIGTLQSTGAFVSVNGQTTCTTRAPVTLGNFPVNTIIDYTNVVNGRLDSPFADEVPLRAPACNN